MSGKSVPTLYFPKLAICPIKKHISVWSISSKKCPHFSP